MEKRMHRKRAAARAGYSLVEVTLALLVVAIGLTATFALFPEGLKATRAAEDDTEVALVAEYVFTSLDLAAGLEGSAWDIADTGAFYSLALSQDIPSSQFPLVAGRQAVFYWIPQDYDLGDGNFAAARDAGFWTSAFTYELTIVNGTWKNLGTPGVVKSATLKVWPGEYIGAPPAGEPRIFYREILPLR